MGLVYLPTWKVDSYGINVGKYTKLVPWNRHGIYMDMKRMVCHAQKQKFFDLDISSILRSSIEDTVPGFGLEIFQINKNPTP